MLYLRERRKKPCDIFCSSVERQKEEDLHLICVPTSFQVNGLATNVEDHCYNFIYIG